MAWDEEKNKAELRAEARKMSRELEESSKKLKAQHNAKQLGSKTDKYVQEQVAQNKIINPFIRQHLEARITAARWALALGVAVTFLFKGQWILWILFVVFYKLYVKKATEEAMEADRKGRGDKK